jgi:phasin family protein
LAHQFDDFQKYGKEQLEVMTTSSSSLAKGWQTIAAESSEYSKKSFENGSAFLEKLLGAKSLENAIQIQSEYAKTYFEELVGYVTKTGELYSNLAKEAFKPIETAITKVQAAKELAAAVRARGGICGLLARRFQPSWSAELTYHGGENAMAKCRGRQTG